MGSEDTAVAARHRLEPRTPRARIALLAIAVVACVLHGYVAIVFNDGPTPVRAWVVNGVLFAVVVVAGAYLLDCWTRRWAVILAIVGVGWVAANTVFFALVFQRLNR